MRGQYPEKQKSHFIARLHGPREAVGPSSVRPSVRDDGGEPGVGWRRGARSIDSWAFLSASLETGFSVGLVAQILRITALSVCYSATLSSIYLLITTNLTCGGGCTAESTPPPDAKMPTKTNPLLTVLFLRGIYSSKHGILCLGCIAGDSRSLLLCSPIMISPLPCAGELLLLLFICTPISSRPQSFVRY